jgi:hypothetical protein
VSTSCAAGDAGALNAEDCSALLNELGERCAAAAGEISDVLVIVTVLPPAR